MVWDLGKAMQKKQEFESARLMDFEFRQRARATRLLARLYELDEREWVREIAGCDNAGLIALLAQRTGREVAAVSSDFQRCFVVARRQLIEERGDPTPYRLG